MKAVLVLACILISVFAAVAQPAWRSALDSNIRFYQTTDLGLLIVGTERGLYAVDGLTGEQLWRLEVNTVRETAVTPVPGTDVLLLSRDVRSKSRLESVDVLTGSVLWQSEKIKGDVLQLAADPENDVVALVAVKDASGEAGSGLKRKPVVHVLRMSTGDELWKRELDGEIEMMPSRFGGDTGNVSYTLDNYRAPLIVNGRLFLFYEGSTSFDVLTGKESEREKFKVNEDGLALTEADPVIDAARVFTSGRGKIRAVSRRSGRIEWKADDIGVASELTIVGDTLYARTGGRFTRLEDGETESKGPYGVAAIDAAGGRIKWRYKGADKGITNFVFADERTLVVADGDDVVLIDAATGRRALKFKHRVGRAEFVLINESGAIVVGGRDEIAAFAAARFDRAGRSSSDADGDARELWRARREAPSRGALRIVGGIALRAAALYFRYGGVATSALGFVRNGVSLANAANSFRWSGLRSRFGSFDLTTLAGSSAAAELPSRFYSYGAIARTPSLIGKIPGLQIRRAASFAAGNISRQSDIERSIADRLDPVRSIERLSAYLLRKKQLSGLRGNYMYFYTSLPKPFGQNGLVGVNVHTGQEERFTRLSDPDPKFVTDETANFLYSADGPLLQAFGFVNR